MNNLTKNFCEETFISTRLFFQAPKPPVHTDQVERRTSRDKGPAPRPPSIARTDDNKIVENQQQKPSAMEVVNDTKPNGENRKPPTPEKPKQHISQTHDQQQSSRSKSVEGKPSAPTVKSKPMSVEEKRKSAPVKPPDSPTEDWKKPPLQKQGSLNEKNR